MAVLDRAELGEEQGESQFGLDQQLDRIALVGAEPFGDVLECGEAVQTRELRIMIGDPELVGERDRDSQEVDRLYDAKGAGGAQPRCTGVERDGLDRGQLHHRSASRRRQQHGSVVFKLVGAMAARIGGAVAANSSAGAASDAEQQAGQCRDLLVYALAEPVVLGLDGCAARSGVEAQEIASWLTNAQVAIRSPQAAQV